MQKQDFVEQRTVALYWDFENIHAGLCEEKEPGGYARGDFRFKPQDPLVNVQAVVDMAASFGPIAVNRAYCNWQFFGRYRDQLLQNAVELIQLFPPGSAAKNGADIKLCLDAAEDIVRFPHIGTVIIVGGDSDFMPLSQKIKAAGRVLVGVGTRRGTNRHWAKSCHEFRYYDTLIEVVQEAATTLDAMPSTPEASKPSDDAPASSSESVPPDPGERSSPQEILGRALRLLADKRGEPWVNKAEIWPMIKRLDPTFSLTENEFPTFSAMLKGLEAMVEIRKGEFDQQVRLR
jgi:hypothetical protein